ncbi:hypothetical protein FLAN108750_10835 [Flavobacterium antarcticum]
MDFRKTTFITSNVKPVFDLDEESTFKYGFSGDFLKVVYLFSNLLNIQNSK